MKPDRFGEAVVTVGIVLFVVIFVATVLFQIWAVP